MLRRRLVAVALPALLVFCGFSESAMAAPKNPRRPATLRCAKNQTPVKNKAGRVVACRRTAAGRSSTARRPAAKPAAKKPAHH